MHVHTAPSGEAWLQARSLPWLIGVIHLPALPGAPLARLPVNLIADQACQDAEVLQRAGFTAVMLENFHDTPFLRDSVEPETVAALAVVTAAVRRCVAMPVGVNVLRNDALAALGVAVSAGGNFMRVNVLSGAAATDQGIVQGQAATLLRRRAVLDQRVAILADVDVKHATSLDTRPLRERAADLVRRAGADAVLVTGHATGSSCDLSQLDEVKGAVSPAPVLAASGTSAASVREVLSHCDGVVVGTAIKDPETGRVCRSRATDYLNCSSP